MDAGPVPLDAHQLDGMPVERAFALAEGWLASVSAVVVVREPPALLEACQGTERQRSAWEPDASRRLVVEVIAHPDGAIVRLRAIPSSSYGPQLQGAGAERVNAMAATLGRTMLIWMVTPRPGARYACLAGHPSG